MGNTATALGDGLSCFRTHQDQGAVQAGGIQNTSRDLDDAVLAAVNQGIAANQSGLVQTITLSFSCQNLPNLDTFTRTDGMVVLYRKVGSQWHKLGMTEVISDNLAPQWVKSFDVQYHFEQRENFKVEIYDVDDLVNINTLANHDFVGNLEFTIHEVVTARNQTLEKNLVNPERPAGQSGTIKITGEERQGGSKEEVLMKVQCRIPQSSGMNFFLINKVISPTLQKPIYKSEIQPLRNGMYQWNLLNVLSADLAGDDADRQIKFDFFESAKSGKHQFLGNVVLTLAQLKEGQKEYQVNDNKGRPKQGCSMSFAQLDIKPRNTFLEYIFGGCEIGLTIAIDFTLSNGHPSKPNSLHYIHDLQKNEYLNAIKAVGSILQYYDNDKQIPVLGFGATIPPYMSQANHCFALNGNIFDPEVDGIENVIEVYKHAITKVELYGPTNFSPILNLVNEMTRGMGCSQQNQKYNILLIITDGIISDMQNTIDEIVDGSSLPLSIIIVGVGSADFSSMDVLDADEEPLYSQKYRKHMSADIVQFVPFREFQHNPMQLAKETLEEVPGQMLNYFRVNGITPLPTNEEKRRQLQAKLGTQRSLGGHLTAEKDDFFASKKEKFLQQMQSKGYDFFEVQDFIERNKMVSLDSYIVEQNLRSHQSFLNPLAQFRPKESLINQSYAFYDPQNHPDYSRQISSAPRGQPLF